MAVIDYDAWARTYDDTRGASNSVLVAITAALGEPGGRSLLDIGGGTGNFAVPLSRTGFRVTLADYSREMLLRARAKLTADFVLIDAQRLPFADGTFDCAVSVNVLGHLPDWRSALREARRVLREGPLVLKVSTRETVTANWIIEYFPTMLDHAPLHHYQPAEVTVQALRNADFTDVEASVLHYDDASDGSFQALKHEPPAFLDDRRIMNTAALMRVPETQRDKGIERIRRDYKSGRLGEIIARYEPLVARYGDGFLFRATP